MSKTLQWNKQTNKLSASSSLWPMPEPEEPSAGRDFWRRCVFLREKEECVEVEGEEDEEDEATWNKVGVVGVEDKGEEESKDKETEEVEDIEVDAEDVDKYDEEFEEIDGEFVAIIFSGNEGVESEGDDNDEGVSEVVADNDEGEEEVEFMEAEEL